MSINAKLNGVTTENVTQLNIKNKSGTVIGTVDLEEVSSGSEGSGLQPYLGFDVVFKNFDKNENWTYSKFEVTENIANATVNTAIRIPNPIGRIPQKYYVLPTTETISKILANVSTANLSQWCFGGYNIGNIDADSNDNRTVAFNIVLSSNSYLKYGQLAPVATAWNLVSSSAGGIADSEYINIRHNGSQNPTKFVAGEYIIAVI